jgi:hypothetical protein
MLVLHDLPMLGLLTLQVIDLDLGWLEAGRNISEDVYHFSEAAGGYVGQVGVCRHLLQTCRIPSLGPDAGVHVLRQCAILGAAHGY